MSRPWQGILHCARWRLGELNLSDASAIHKHNRIGFCILCVRCYYYGVVLLFELNREERLLLIHTSLGRVWIRTE